MATATDLAAAARAFDEKRLATPADWAALDDFDEDAIIAQMTKRVEETFLETQREVRAEKEDASRPSQPLQDEPASVISATPSQQPATSQPQPPPQPQPVHAAQPGAESTLFVKGDQVMIHGLSSRPELNEQVGTIERYNAAKGRFAVRLADGKSILLKAANLEPSLTEID